MKSWATVASAQWSLPGEYGHYFYVKSSNRTQISRMGAVKTTAPIRLVM